MADIITIRDAENGTILAQGQLETDVIVLEGSYYFDRANVNFGQLKLTGRTYTCPYKGVSLWVDLDTPTAHLENVAWVYDHVNPGFEHIKGRVGFYMRTMRGIVVEKASA